MLSRKDRVGLAVILHLQRFVLDQVEEPSASTLVLVKLAVPRSYNNSSGSFRFLLVYSACTHDVCVRTL